ncbi:MAG TPA: hypothetical protein VHP11_05625, partial [Tepidisphaeraceae bacterium]|nr:hypothetical protein [Tepidisphaeraceae bacterium]
PWITNTDLTTAAFITGQLGHTYAFYSIARDKVGNEEAAPAEPDTTTRVSIVVATEENDTIVLRVDPADAERLQVFVNASTSGEPTYALPMAAADSLHIAALAGNDTLIIDLGNGNPISGSLSFDGGDGQDVLQIITGNAGQTLFADGTKIRFTGGTVDYSGLEGMAIEGSAADDSLTITAALPFTPSFHGGSGNDTLTIQAGDYVLTSDTTSGTANLHLVANSTAKVNLAGLQSLASLTIDDSAQVSLAAGGDKVLITRDLSINGNGVLDLADNDLIVQATPATRQEVLTQVSSWIKSARNTSPQKWTGWGITSIAARNGARQFTGLAPVLNDQGNGKPILGTFAGVSVGTNDILVKYTWNGDVNLDGKVDIADYFLVDSGFITQKGGYRNGDLNFDGTITGGAVDISDYFLIDAAFIGQDAVLATKAPSPLQQLFSTKPLL